MQHHSQNTAFSFYFQSFLTLMFLSLSFFMTCKHGRTKHDRSQRQQLYSAMKWQALQE